MKTAAPTLQEFFSHKIVDSTHLALLLEKAKSAKKTVATLNGSFDLLHAGHLTIIFEASRQADILVVALNTDASIKRYKSPNRPIIPLELRLQATSALEFVDYVTWFDEDDPRVLLRLLKPNVHVNGADYGEQCIEAETVRQLGGRLHLVPIVGEFSTSNVIKKIQSLP